MYVAFIHTGMARADNISSFGFSFFVYIYLLFIWLCWVLVAACKLLVVACKLLVAASGI